MNFFLNQRKKRKEMPLLVIHSSCLSWLDMTIKALKSKLQSVQFDIQQLNKEKNMKDSVLHSLEEKIKSMDEERTKISKSLTTLTVTCCSNH
jgi:hypothetical protein